jgi:hypothetical protein
MDLPSVALEMMQTFLSSGSFLSSRQNLDSKVPGSEGSCGVCPTCDIQPALDVNKNLNAPTWLEGEVGNDNQSVDAMRYTVVGFLCGSLFVFLIRFSYNLMKKDRDRTQISIADDEYEFEMSVSSQVPYSDNSGKGEEIRGLT